MSETVQVDDLTLQLRRSQRRQTIGITVERDGSLIVAAPVDASQGDIEQVVRQKQFWIYTKLARKSLLREPVAPPREFVSGEGFLYLGRSYRLLLADPPEPDTPPLQLKRGRFRLRRDVLSKADQLFIEWYQEHAQRWIEQRVERYAERMSVQPAGVTVQELGYRWGSCGQDGTLYFHWRTICLPPRFVEYVIVHEMAHLHQPTHGEVFWQRLERVLPDYAERKRWLAENGRYYALTFAG